MKLVIQIPCYNEELTIKETLADLPTHIPGVDKIIVLLVDDGSRDETSRIGLENGADYVVRHPLTRDWQKPSSQESRLPWRWGPILSLTRMPITNTLGVIFQP